MILSVFHLQSTWQGSKGFTRGEHRSRLESTAGPGSQSIAGRLRASSKPAIELQSPCVQNKAHLTETQWSALLATRRCGAALLANEQRPLRLGQEHRPCQDSAWGYSSMRVAQAELKGQRFPEHAL